MKRLFLRKSIAAILFVCFLFSFSFLNLRTALPEIKQVLSDFNNSKMDPSERTAFINEVVNESVFEKEKFIEGYGFVQRILEKNEMANFDVIKDVNGSLHYTGFAKGPNDSSEIVRRIELLNKDMEQRGTKLMYLMMPHKYVKGFTKFPFGMPYDYHNETADVFLNDLEKSGVESMDFRENMLSSRIAPDQLFFKTDHHWTIETSFWAFEELVKDLDETFQTLLDESGLFTDIDQYNAVTFPKSYLGSMGRKTGIGYGGMDDFTLIYPKFQTNYSFYADLGMGEEPVELTGRFEDTLISTDAFRSGASPFDYTSHKYSAYLKGNAPFVRVVNHDNSQGPKVLFIKDSFAVPLAAFFSTVCSEVMLIDPRYYEGDMMEFVSETDLDFVFLAMNPQSLSEKMFPFYEN